MIDMTTPDSPQPKFSTALLTKAVYAYETGGWRTPENNMREAIMIVYAATPPTPELVKELRELVKDWERRADAMHPFANVCADELTAILARHAP